jgi:receptor-type tyrosine-protein phosphatase N
MDISTGHMVLNYMEDHLNNKQRLEQEWVGLCAYEAEPASTSVAFKVEQIDSEIQEIISTFSPKIDK